MKKLARPILPLLGLCISAASPPPAGPTLADSVKFRQQVLQAFDRLQPCGRDAPGLKFAVMAALWQVDDTIRIHLGEAAVKQAEKAAKLPAPACDTPQDQQIKLLTHRLGFEWLSRMAFAHKASGMPGWSAKMADIPPMPPEMEALRLQLGTNLGTAHSVSEVDGMARQIGLETETDLALICKTRLTVRTSIPRACPTLPSELNQHRATAEARIANVELMAARFAQSEGTGGMKPNPLGQPFGFYEVTNVQLWTSRSLVQCARQQPVVYLTDPGAIRQGDKVTLPVRGLSGGNITGTVVVQPENPQYPNKLKIVSGGPASTAPEKEFYRCPNSLPKSLF